MVKRFTKIGNSLAIIIDRPILNLLKISEDAEFDVSTDGKGLHLVPIQTDRRSRIAAAKKKVDRVYGKTFEKLAK